MNAIEIQWLLVYQSHSITMSRLNLNLRNRFAAVHAREARQEMNSKMSSKSTKDVMGIVKKELAIFEVEGNPCNILGTSVVLKSTKSAQVPSTSVVLKVLPKQILLYYKIRTKKYAKNFFFGTVQHF
jgi:hypothetical protein